MSVSVEMTSNASVVGAILARAFGSIDSGTRDPDIAIAFKRIGARLVGFERRRFLTLSRSGGSGEWPDLAISTKIRRLTKTKAQRAKINAGLQQTRDRRALKGKAGKTTRLQYLESLARGRKFPILVDTAILLNSLSGGTPDSINDLLDYGIRVGTRVNYGIHHQDPQIPGRPPRRRIIAPPDAATLASCEADIETGMLRSIQRRLSTK